MGRIKVTKDALSKAIYEGVAEAMLPDGENTIGANKTLEDMLSNYESAGKKFVMVGEHLYQNILPEAKSLYGKGVVVLKKIFGDGLNLSGMQCSCWDDQFTARIPITSLDGYKSYLEANKPMFNKVLEEFTSEYTNFDGELNSENYEQMKQAFLNNQDWLVSSIDEALDEVEDELGGRYSTLSLSFHRNEITLEIEFPYNIEKYVRFINGDE